ncbi:MAG TPA: hypothetical protein VE715_12315 [Blastocatellia bacterium]|nr:hypothetical protein [Blastocatellia bacterium]
MKTLCDNEESAKARYEIERATIDCAEMRLFIDDVQAATLARGNFEFSVEWGKLIFAWWDEGVSQSWRVTAYEIDRGELRLRGTRGMSGGTTLLTLRDPAKWHEMRARENPPPGERRKVYAETLSRLITKSFDGAKIQRAATGSSRSRSGVSRYARLVLKSGGETVLAIGVNESESQAEVDDMLAAGLVGFAAFNEKRDEKDRAKRLWFCLPKGRSQTAMERVALLDVSHLGGRIECFEVDEGGEELRNVRPVMQDELLNSHPREAIWPGASTPDERWRERIINLAPDLIETRRDARSGRERFEIKGLEFARLGHGGHAKFGVAGANSQGEANPLDLPDLKDLGALTESNLGELESLVREIVRYRSADCLERRHPFYFLRAEAWLESLLRRDIRRLDATFDERFVYSQIPAWRADERSVIDLLTVNHEGRLAVIEIKAAEDPQLPLQGTDYWLRVEQARLRNEFKKRGLFEGVDIADLSPLLYLVAPRLRFHRTFATVARCVSPRIEAYRIGVNTNWREGVKVHTRERINSREMV